MKKLSNEDIKEIFSWIKYISAAFIFSFIINNYVIIHANVPTGSMMDTVLEKSRVVGNRLSYNMSDPARLDVVTFPQPDDNDINLLKRIIGLPNEKLEIIDGRVYINDSATPLDEPYVRGIPSGDFGPVDIPEGCYFMMGDNRNNSIDARDWDNKFVKKEDIQGKVFFTYYPELKFIK